MILSWYNGLAECIGECGWFWVLGLRSHRDGLFYQSQIELWGLGRLAYGGMIVVRGCASPKWASEGRVNGIWIKKGAG